MKHRAGRSGRIVAFSLLGVSAWAFTTIAAVPASPGPSLKVEEVLRQSAGIAWTDDGVATRHRLQRRERGSDGQWGAWVDVGTPSRADRSGYLVDAGPDAKGLAPGTYAWQMQSQRTDGALAAWSEWSAPAELTIPPQCAGGDRPPGNEAHGSLPTVEIGDLDGDRRYTGADVWEAMQRCSKLGGCVLSALPVTYDDVAITLYGINGQQDDFPCYSWKTSICKPMPPFPKGLVIEGHGSRTVFRSPVWQTPYRPAAVFEIWHAPGVQLRFRNFVLDGRKREQPDPAVGVNDVAGWRHKGIDVTAYFGPDHSKRYPDGCVHNVTARDFMLSGIDVDHVKNWRIEYNRVHDIGCWKGVTECPRLTVPDTNPPPAWGCDGHKAGGYGIVVQNYSDDVLVSHNHVSQTSKYAYGFKGGADGTDPIRRLLARDNLAENIGSVGIFVAGTIDSVIERNTVDGTHQPGCRKGGAWNSWGIQTHGTVTNTRIQGNTLKNLAAVGIGSNAVADGLVFAHNTIENTCIERNAKVESVQGAIHFAEGSSGTFTLSDNKVLDNHCSMALAVCWGSQAQVRVDGGYYSSTESSDYGALYVESGHSPRKPRVELEGGAVFENVGASRSPGIVAAGNGRVVVKDDSVQIKRFREAFATTGSRMDGGPTQKVGSIVRCDADSSSPDCL